ncbi:MAG: hypothetical protein DWQ36_14735 [Acidobacteria bacterium]|nr:MAG: hypothetical protein DWQ30_03470 [Acidobacteriota bacterium]REK06148.1 MAG: hypothetical protein DWQ36_14735 [Acidobacteriota bacterium]
MAATINPFWVVLGGMLVDSHFCGRLRAAVDGSNFPALDLQRELKIYGFPLGVSDLAHAALLLGPRWGEVRPAIEAFEDTRDLLRLPNLSETAAAIGLLVPDTDYRNGLLAAADQGHYLKYGAKSPGFLAAEVDLVQQFLDNDKADEKLVTLEKVAWHSGFKIVQARCSPRYNIPEDDMIALQPTVFLEEFSQARFGERPPSTEELVEALGEIGITAGGGVIVLRPEGDPNE